MFACSDWEIQRSHPKETLICSICRKPFPSLNLCDAASISQPLPSINHLARCSGMTKRITFHHLGHGASQDVACLPPPSPDNAQFNLQNAQQLLNHLNQPLATGTTSNYVGFNPRDFFKKRIVHSLVSIDKINCFSEISLQSTSKKTILPIHTSPMFPSCPEFVPKILSRPSLRV